MKLRVQIKSGIYKGQLGTLVDRFPHDGDIDMVVQVNGQLVTMPEEELVILDKAKQEQKKVSDDEPLEIPFGR